MPSTPRLRVGLYINDPKATTLRFLRCVQEWGFAFTSVWRDELADLRPGAVDVLLLHGGWYGIDRTPGQNQHPRQATPEHDRRAAAVRSFVAAGGGLVGVCAGAYNVVWLDLIPADISRSQGVGPHALEVVDAAHPLTRGVIVRTEGRTDRQWQPVPVIRMNGPIFFPHRRETMVFSYDWEQRLGAVLAAPYERGRAAAISPHPERADGDLGDAIPATTLAPAALLLRNALLWAAGREVE